MLGCLKQCDNTYKLLQTGKVKQLHHPKIIACDDVKARVGHTGTDYVGFFCVTGPDPNDLIPKDTGGTHTNI